MHKLQSHLLKLRRKVYAEWNKVGSQCVQQICERIKGGYDKFFRREAKRPPTFKSWKKYQSVTFKQAGYTLNGNVLTINALKLKLKYHQSRPIDGKVQTLSVKRDSVGDYWIVVTIRKGENDFNRKPMTGKTAGFDFGLKHFLTQDDGTKIESPLMLSHNLNKLRMESRKLSKRVKGSKSRDKARISLARLHRAIFNQREDFQWKLANKLVSEYDAICLEALSMNAMKRIWGRKVSDLSFNSFVSKLSWLCVKYGKKLVRVNQWEATSKVCSCCGNRMKEMPLKVRSWTCPVCGEVHDRDINAAKNILRVGMSTLGIDDVRPATQAIIDDARITFL